MTLLSLPPGLGRDMHSTGYCNVTLGFRDRSTMEFRDFFWLIRDIFLYIILLLFLEMHVFEQLTMQYFLKLQIGLEYP